MRIALFGGSFDPIGLHHFKIVELLIEIKMFDQIIIVPCGPRPDKASVNDLEPFHRAAMIDMAFADLTDKVKVDLTDLENDTFTRTIHLEEKYHSYGDIWHVVGLDLVADGNSKKSAIQKFWINGDALYEKSNFVVIKRHGYPFNKEDLPVNSIVLEPIIHGSSTEIRNKIFNHQSIAHLVPPKIAQYIERYNLYRGRLPLQQTLCRIEEPRILIVADERNPKALQIKKKLKNMEDFQHPNLIVDIGGDGNKIRAIQSLWRLRLPFLGINAGHRGYLLNDIDPSSLSDHVKNLIIQHLPLLHVELLTLKGEWITILGFNEAWIERETGQTAWIELKWNETNVIPRVVGDGLMVSTAAGSTGYAKNICGFSLPSHVRELLLVGLGIAEPTGWQHTIFPNNAIFEFRCLKVDKRPVRAFVDGISHGSVKKIRIRVSRIASAELAFVRGYDITEKHTRIQLPYFQPVRKNER